MNFPAWLTLAFIVLKLTGFIDWSWWLVLCPMVVGEILGTLLIAIANSMKSDRSKTLKNILGSTKKKP